MKIFAVLAAFLVLADEWLKYQALLRLPPDTTLTDPGIVALAIHKNWGIAFDIPFKLPFVFLVSALIGIWLVRVIWQTYRTRPEVALSALLIIIGATGNLYDRIVYGFTVDYIILFGRSAINISDVVILTGVLLLLLTTRRTKRTKTLPSDPQTN